ncbi:MAG: hypothetical protein KBT27_02200 [Prevotellaceae bacterium]|nr:hypothetical protein [Candidatus Faecinaster equi]
MKIPEEVLERYQISTLHEDEDIYRTFLQRTDYEIIKGFESLLTEPLKFLQNIITLAATLKELSGWRAVARIEIEKGEDK